MEYRSQALLWAIKGTLGESSSNAISHFCSAVLLCLYCLLDKLGFWITQLGHEI